MADITMCKGEGCELKYTCYRYTAKPSIRQSYFVITPIKKHYQFVKEGCDFYLKNK